MQLDLHEIHFCDWAPEPVACMAYSPSFNMLAVGRENSGNVDLYNYVWHNYNVGPQHNCHIPMGHILGHWLQGSVTSLYWTQSTSSTGGSNTSAELVATGTSGCLLHLDIRSKTVKGRYPLVGMIGLCIAGFSNKIAVGTDTGVISLFHVEDGSIANIGTLPGIEGRILSLDWHCNKTVNLIAASTDRGKVALFDLHHNQLLSTVSLSAESGRPVSLPTKVNNIFSNPKKSSNLRVGVCWSLSFVQPSVVPTASSPLMLLCAESSGHVSVWNLNSALQCHLAQRFPTHRADVLTLLCIQDKNSVSCWASGVDPLLVRLQYKPNENEWVVGEKFSKPTDDGSDVRVLCGNHQHLVTGSLSGQLHNFDLRHHMQMVRVTPSPVLPLVSISNSLTITKNAPPLHLMALLSADRSAIHLYSLLGDHFHKITGDTNEDAAPPLAKKPRHSQLEKHSNHSQIKGGTLSHLIRIQPKRGESVVCMALSPQADMLLYSDSQRTRLLRLVITDGNFQSVEAMSSTSYRSNAEKNEDDENDEDEDDASVSSGHESLWSALSESVSRQGNTSSECTNATNTPWSASRHVAFSMLPLVCGGETVHKSLALMLEDESRSLLIRYAAPPFNLYDKVVPIKDEVIHLIEMIAPDPMHEFIAVASKSTVFLYDVSGKCITRTFGPPNANFFLRVRSVCFTGPTRRLAMLYSENVISCMKLKVSKKMQRVPWCSHFMEAVTHLKQRSNDTDKTVKHEGLVKHLWRWSRAAPFGEIVWTGKGDTFVLHTQNQLALLDMGVTVPLTAVKGTGSTSDLGSSPTKKGGNTALPLRFKRLPKDILTLATTDSANLFVMYEVPRLVEQLQSKKYGL